MRNFEWDITNVSSPSMTYFYLSVNHRPRATVHIYRTLWTAPVTIWG